MTLRACAPVAWLAWFLIEPLPNANNTAGPNAIAVRRAWLVLKALPHVVPETSFEESFLGQGLLELSHVEYLPQRAPIVLSALLIAAAAVGLGDLVLRRLRLERMLGLGLGEGVALGYGVGAGLLGVLTLISGRLGWLDSWLVRGALAVMASTGLFRSGLLRAPRPRIDRG